MPLREEDIDVLSGRRPETTLRLGGRGNLTTEEVRRVAEYLKTNANPRLVELR
jgi:hypothetical protein